MQNQNCLKDSIVSLSPKEREALISQMSPDAAYSLLNDWNFWARPEQLAPQWDWRVWMILAGRGFGKTRTGAEWVRQEVKRYPYVNLIAATADDARDIMVDGESGILAICPKEEKPIYKTSKRQLAWPNGAKSLIFTADEPDRLRGKQHMKLWMDEFAAWRYLDSYDQAMMGLRLGNNPQAVITTTPRPLQRIRDLIKDPTTHVTRGSSYDNRANLAPAFFNEIIKKYEGTRLGRQEIDAEILDDNPNALWKREWIDEARISKLTATLRRVVVAVDPAVTSNKKSNETGIIVIGLGHDNQGYVLADYTIIGTPEQWGRKVIEAYEFFQADRIIGETNNGGDLIEAVLRSIKQNIKYNKVHASRGKAIRAEPASGLYEQRRIHHVGSFPILEDQMCSFDPLDDDAPSPDRMDALVWGITELFDGATPSQSTYVPHMGR